MKWLRNPSERDSEINKNYYLVSDCRRYTLAKYFDSGGARYELWRLKEMIATRLASAEVAKAMATKDDSLNAHLTAHPVQTVLCDEVANLPHIAA